MVTRFKLRPLKEERYPQFWWVYIFETKHKMLNFLDKRGVEHENCEAICQNYEKLRIENDVETTLPEIGFMCFHVDFIGGGIVSHELLHGAIYYFRRVLGISMAQIDNFEDSGEANEQEEEFCFLMQMMTREFWERYYKKLD